MHQYVPHEGAVKKAVIAIGYYAYPQGRVYIVTKRSILLLLLCMTCYYSSVYPDYYFLDTLLYVGGKYRMAR